MLQEPDGKVHTYCPCDEVVADVVIVPSVFAPDERVWDQVCVNGKWCGNRHGGIKAFASLVSFVKPPVDFEVDEHHLCPIQPMFDAPLVACGAEYTVVKRLLAEA
jgi:hypothetical protein